MIFGLAVEVTVKQVYVTFDTDLCKAIITYLVSKAGVFKSLIGMFFN